MHDQLNCGPYLPELVYNKKHNPIKVPHTAVREPEDTNNAFAKSDQLFKESCSAAGIPASTAQASKWRNKKGLAYKYFQHRNKKSIMKVLPVNEFLVSLNNQGSL